MKKDGILDNLTMWILVKNLALLEIKNEITLPELREKLKLEVNHPYMYQIYKFLKQKGAVEVVKVIGGTFILRINNKKLNDLLENSKIYLEVFQYIETMRTVL